ncbi:hypothetical protein TYRP_003283 [Tyrophagus putrescentiae]|nr:hypothetical protein TYRP_003283 [Tyrophagus putrescentiae]
MKQSTDSRRPASMFIASIAVTPTRQAVPPAPTGLAIDRVVTGVDSGMPPLRLPPAVGVVAPPFGPPFQAAEATCTAGLPTAVIGVSGFSSSSMFACGVSGD